MIAIRTEVTFVPNTFFAARNDGAVLDFGKDAMGFDKLGVVVYGGLITNIQDRRQPMDKTLNLEDFGQGLRKRRQELGVTLDELAKTTGISKPYISNIETARTPGPPSAEKLVRLAEALQLDSSQLLQQADWLRTPISIRNLLPAQPPRRADGSINLDAVLDAFAGDKAQAAAAVTGGALTGWLTEGAGLQAVPLVRIPLINRVAAGKASEYTDMDYPAGVADAYIAGPAAPPEAVADATPGPATAGNSGLFALRITGNSMEPLYQHGDIVVFSDHETPREGDDCLVRLDARENFSTTFKRVYFSGDEKDEGVQQVRLVPLNTAHPTRSVARERITGMYPALWRVSPAPRAKDGGGLASKSRSRRDGAAKPRAADVPAAPPAPSAPASAAGATATSRVAIEFD